MTGVVFHYNRVNVIVCYNSKFWHDNSRMQKKKWIESTQDESMVDFCIHGEKNLISLHKNKSFVNICMNIDFWMNTLTVA